MKVFLYYWTH